MRNIILSICAMFLSVSFVQAQESEEATKSSKMENLHIMIKDGAKPDIYVDGKKFDFPMDLLDEDRIKSVVVIKGDQAIKEYNAKNGVVLITTKKVIIDTADSKVQIKITKSGKKQPMIIIDGESSDKKILNKLSPDDIESIQVVKGEQALKKYDAPQGVIIVTTKKGNRKR